MADIVVADANLAPPEDKKYYWILARDELRNKNPGVYADYEKIQQKNREGSRGHGAGFSPAEADTGHSIADEMLEIAQGLREKTEARAWRLPFKVRKHEILLRNCLKEVVKALKLFKDVGTAIASLDRVHAGIPWAAINLVFELILNENEEYENVLKAVSALSPLIAKYHRVESIYFDTPGELLDPEFEKLLVDLYVEILTLETDIVRHFRRNWFTKKLGAVTSWHGWAARKQSLRDKDAACMQFASIYDAERLKNMPNTIFQVNGAIDTLSAQIRNISKSFDKKMSEIHGQIEREWELRKYRETKETLDQISDLAYVEMHDNLLGDEYDEILGSGRKMGTAYSQSGIWLKNTGAFSAWYGCQAEAIAVLWLKGPPGVGKSCYVSRVIEWCLGRGLGPKEQLAYFYCAREMPGNKSCQPRLVLQSILRQIAWVSETEILEDIKEAMQGLGKRTLSESRCLELIALRAENLESMIIIIDGLDHCEQFKELLKSLSTLRKNSHGIVRLLLSSRIHVPVQDAEYFPNCATVDLPSLETQHDIEFFIANELFGGIANKPGSSNRQPRDSFLLGGVRPDLELELFQLLCNRSMGMFLWADLQLKVIFGYSRDLSNQYGTVAAVKGRIDSIRRISGTPELTKMYRAIYEMNTDGSQGPGAKRPQADKAYRLALCSFEPLTSTAIAQAVSIQDDLSIHQDVDGAYIMKITSSMLQQDPQSGKIRFTHICAREFFEDSDGVFGSIFSPAENHTALRQMCLAALSTPSFYATSRSENDETGSRHLQKDSFYQYAVDNWPQHYEFSNFDQRIDGIEDTLLWKFLDPKNAIAFRTWHRHLETRKASDNWERQSWSTFNQSFAAASWGLLGILSNLNRRGLLDTKQRDSERRTILHVASSCGQHDIVRFLIGLGMPRDERAFFDRTPLHMACLG